MERSQPPSSLEKLHADQTQRDTLDIQGPFRVSLPCRVFSVSGPGAAALWCSAVITCVSVWFVLFSGVGSSVLKETGAVCVQAGPQGEQGEQGEVDGELHYSCVCLLGFNGPVSKWLNKA